MHIVKYGIFERMEDEIQTFGHAARANTMEGLCMTMVEPWVYDLDLGNGDDKFDGSEDGKIDPRVGDAF